MNWSDPLTAAAFERWVVGVAGTGTVRQGQRLDPFATSMRRFTPAAAWLEVVEHGGALPARGGSGVQIQTDLRGAGLLEPDQPETLTDLGRQCLEGWRHAGVDNADDAGELTRSVVAVVEGVRLGVPLYLEMLRFWKQLRTRYSLETLLDSPEWLYLASYLNQEHDGYSPWRAVVAQQHEPVLDFNAEWASLVAGLVTADATAAADTLRQRVDHFASRSFGRVVFCMAMELHVLAETGEFQRASERLAAWRFPRG
jgi:hypothetical protein